MILKQTCNCEERASLIISTLERDMNNIHLLKLASPANGYFENPITWRSFRPKSIFAMHNSLGRIRAWSMYSFETWSLPYYKISIVIPYKSVGLFKSLDILTLSRM